MPTALSRELETYQEQRERLLGSAEGKFVLIHDQEIAGVYEDQMDAITQGYQRFGNVPFLVKQIVRIEVPVNYMTMQLGF